MRAEVAALGRFDHRWIKYAAFNPHMVEPEGCVMAARPQRHTQSGIVQFSARVDMATHSMAKRRHFGSFCLALLYNFQH